MVVQQAGTLTASGLGIGLVCAVGACTLIRKVLFGVQAWDAPGLFGVALLLGLASLAASFVPAHRAASVNPTEALRTRAGRGPVLQSEKMRFLLANDPHLQLVNLRTGQTQISSLPACPQSKTVRFRTKFSIMNISAVPVSLRAPMNPCI
jgi:predicted lysophospholipase L1 biosynthesis ABC-type transport system permease subunit